METSVCSPSNLSRVHLGITGCMLVSGLKQTGAFHASIPVHLSQSAFPSLLGCILQSPFLPATPLHTVFFLFILMTQYRLLKTRKEITPNGTFFLFLRLFIYLISGYAGSWLPRGRFSSCSMRYHHGHGFSWGARALGMRASVVRAFAVPGL